MHGCMDDESFAGHQKRSASHAHGCQGSRHFEESVCSGVLTPTCDRQCAVCSYKQRKPLFYDFKIEFISLLPLFRKRSCAIMHVFRHSAQWSLLCGKYELIAVARRPPQVLNNKYPSAYDARQACVSAGGHAAFIDTKEEHTAAFALVQQVERRVVLLQNVTKSQNYKRETLIGAYASNDRESTWKWACSDTETVFINYDGSLIKEGEKWSTAKRCLAYTQDTGGQMPIDCNTRMDVLCELRKLTMRDKSQANHVFNAAITTADECGRTMSCTTTSTTTTTTTAAGATEAAITTTRFCACN